MKRNKKRSSSWFLPHFFTVTLLLLPHKLPLPPSLLPLSPPLSPTSFIFLHPFSMILVFCFPLLTQDSVKKRVRNK